MGHQGREPDNSVTQEFSAMYLEKAMHQLVTIVFLTQFACIREVKYYM